MKVKFSDLTFFNNIVKKEIEIKLAELISDSKFKFIVFCQSRQ